LRQASGEAVKSGLYAYTLSIKEAGAETARGGRYTEAGALYRRALAIFEKSLGTTHPKVIACRNNFANLMSRSLRPT
jgi:Tetratricopeptide repeat